MSPEGSLAELIVEDLRAVFAAAADPVRAVAMDAYMKGHGPFFGIATPERRKLQREVFDTLPKRIDERSLLEIVEECWAEPNREFHYAGQDLLRRRIGVCGPGALETIERLIQSRSWWDTVDVLSCHCVGPLVRVHPQLDAEMERWSESGELWLIRSAILHQLAWRDQMDIDWIERICLRHASHRDFFIRKAIGWALRTYAHRGAAQAQRVRQFLADHDDELSPLSKREALNRVRVGD